MTRALLAALSLFVIAGLGAASASVTQKDKKEPETKEVEILGKKISEWVKILRTHNNPKLRRLALIALESSTASRNVALEAVYAATDQEKEKEIQVRLDAVNLVGRMGPDIKPSLKVLVGVLQSDKADSVREAAGTAIANRFSKEAVDYVDALIGALKDPHPGTRAAAAAALRNMGDGARPAFPTLIESALNPKENSLVRAAAVHVLSRHGKDNPKTLPMLTALAKPGDTPAQVREAAVEGLGRVGSDDPDAVAALTATLTDKQLELRKAAAVSLADLGVKAKSGWLAIKERLVFTSVKMSTVATPAEPDSIVRNTLVRLAGSLGKVNDEAVLSLAGVVLHDTSTENRLAAIQELAELGDRAKSAIPVLSKVATEDPRLAIRDAAGKAVTKINGK